MLLPITGINKKTEKVIVQYIKGSTSAASRGICEQSCSMSQEV